MLYSITLSTCYPVPCWLVQKSIASIALIKCFLIGVADGNQDFNLYTTQRFFALHWYMISQQATDMWHMENDNLLYANLDNLLPPMRACGVGLGVPFTEKMQGVASLIFISECSMHEPDFSPVCCRCPSFDLQVKAHNPA